MNRFVKGTLLLIVAAFIGECLEFLINIVLARELGEEGLGHYMTILPTIMFLVVIASLELPVSVSKLIAEKEQKFHLNILQHILRFTIALCIAILIAAFLIFPLIKIFDAYHPMLRWLLLILIPVIAFSSVARGYFMGTHAMGKIAFANFLRRAVQLILLILVYRLFHFETDLAIMIALCTLIATEIVVFAYLVIRFLMQYNGLKKLDHQASEKLSILKSLLNVSLPTTGLRVFYAASFAIKPFLIKVALMQSGMVEELAMAQYGKLAGVAFTIGFFPAFIAHSLLIILIPTVSESFAKRDMRELHSLLNKIMLFTFCYAIPACMIYFLFADQLTHLFIDEPASSGYLKQLIPYFFFHFFVIPLQAFLIGMGLVKHAFLHFVWSTIVSFICIYVFGAMPSMQMNGVILGMNIGIVLLTLMHYHSVLTKMGEPQSWKLSEHAKRLNYSKPA